MKNFWVVVQGAMIAAIILVLWLIKAELTSVAHADTVPAPGIYVVTESGHLVPYKKHKIIRKTTESEQAVPVESAGQPQSDEHAQLKRYKQLLRSRHIMNLKLAFWRQSNPEVKIEPEPKVEPSHKAKPSHTLTAKVNRHKHKTRIKDDDGASARTELVSDGSPIVFSSEPTARQKVYKRYSYWQRHRQTLKIMERIAQYRQYIDQYSALLGFDAELPWGLIAVESAGRSHAVSRVGAKGLGQIYSVPSICHRRAEAILGVNRVNVWDPRENIVLSLVTLDYYTRIKNNNLLMGLVSYNCGPDHHSVVRASGYDDLNIKKSIKHYPIDVLALTLVAKVKKQYGEILPYTEENRQKIESIYLPGLGM